MVPYSYNMVDMGGIDLAEANGTVVPGVYERITEAMNLCGDVILYHWKFAGIDIVPSAYAILQQASSILINGMIQVTELDVVTVLGIDPPTGSIVPLEVTENGVYEAELPVSGFSPVTVIVPERQPVIESLSITENGTYTASSGVDGYSPVSVNVPQPTPTIQSLSITENGTYTAPSGVDGYSPVTVNVSTEEQLPSEYQQVEYLSTGGTIGAVYLPVSIRVGDIISMDVSANNWKERTYMAFAGIKKSLGDTSYTRVEFFVNNGIRRIFISTGTIHDADDPTIVATNGSVSYGGELSNNERIVMNVGFDSAIPDSNVFFGAYSSSEYITNAKLFSLKIEDADQRNVVNLIPCRRKSDSVPGFYDMRTNRFLAAFTGSFTAGPDVT